MAGDVAEPLKLCCTRQLWRLQLSPSSCPIAGLGLSTWKATTLVCRGVTS